MESGREGSPPPPKSGSRLSGIKRWLEKRGLTRPSRPSEAIPSASPTLPVDTEGSPSPPALPPLPPPPVGSRTFGARLPEGSTVQRLHSDTRTHVEYGEKTWTTAQTVRDILQNHLDANTNSFFDKLLSAVIDVDKLSERPNKLGDDFDDFTYTLFRFRKGLGRFSKDAEREMVDLLNSYASSAPIKREFLDAQGKIQLDALKQAIAPIIEIPPQITYKVVNFSAPEGQHNAQWLTFSELQQPPFLERDRPSDPPTAGLRYQIVGMKIEDQGSGFDAKLSAFYKSTKRGQRHLRGKFGEGVKMSEAHLMRHGAYIKMRSRFEINGGRPAHERIWQHRGYLGEDNIVQQKGIQVDLPPGQQVKAGSYTLISIEQADPRFQLEFQANVDPRISGEGIAKNCLEYSVSKYYYPMSQLGYGEKPVGVSLEVSADNQYVQGLKVGSDTSTSQGGQGVTPLFSYDFLDSSILQGRDRSGLNQSIGEQIINFWKHADSLELISELLARITKGDYPDYTTPETGVLDYVLSREFGQIEIGANTQVGRAADLALRAFPSAVNAELGKKNVIAKPDDIQSYKDLITLLQSKGYNIITLKVGIGNQSIQNLNQAHEGNYQFYSISTAHAEVQSTRNEMDRSDERVHESQELFNSAFEELRDISERAGVNIADFAIESVPQFHEVIDTSRESLFNLDFNEDTKKFRFVIRPALFVEAISTSGGNEYWKRRIQVELLATYKRNERFPDYNTLNIASQNTTQLLLNNTLHPGLPDVDVIPTEFNYQPIVIDPLEAIKRFSTEQVKIDEALLGWDMYRSISTFQTSLDQMEEVSQGFNSIPEPYRQKVKDIMGQRVILENGEIGYFDYPENGQGELMFFRQSLDSLSSVGSIEGRPIFRIADKLFMPYEFPKGSVIKSENEYESNTYVMYGDQLLDFAKGSFGPYQFNSHPLIIEKGGFVITMGRSRSDSWVTNALSIMEEGLRTYTITAPERKTGEGMRFLEGVIETPFPSEYGIDEWDNPVRVFQDIVQNHIDASPTGKIDTRFEVQHGPQKVWITEQEVVATDVIVGFQVTDNGDGYTPNDLGTVGKSSKKSPLFAGKYGEGQKMIAAAAVRNGLELKFSSVSNYNGNRFRWQGAVGTKPEEIIIGGKPTNVDRVVFNVTSDIANPWEDYTSSTIIRLPEGKAIQSMKVWQEWLQVIDPKIKDKFGQGGLARYVLPMRARNGEKIIDMGYMRILLDRPGEVYENGLLISTEGRTALGYDVPEIVTTRERNRFDGNKLKEYIANAAYTCSDSALATALMQKFKEKYLFAVVKNPQGTYIREQDINFGHLSSRHYYDFVPAKPFWRQAYNSQLGTYLVYSEQALRDEIRMRTHDLTASYTKPERRKEALRKIEQDYAALANIGHIPSDHIIHARGLDEYTSWSRLFPTVAEYVMDLAEQEVPVADEISKTLQRVVSASNNVLYRTQSSLRGTNEGKRVYDSIVVGKTPREAYLADTLANTFTEQFINWTPEALQQHPERVFVAPANAGYLGLATRDRIGFNELLLVGDDLKKIAGVARHELLHKIYGLRDYTPEFIMLLLESAKANTQ